MSRCAFSRVPELDWGMWFIMRACVCRWRCGRRRGSWRPRPSRSRTPCGPSSTPPSSTCPCRYVRWTNSTTCQPASQRPCMSGISPRACLTLSLVCCLPSSVIRLVDGQAHQQAAERRPKPKGPTPLVRRHEGHEQQLSTLDTPKPASQRPPTHLADLPACGGWLSSRLGVVVIDVPACLPAGGPPRGGAPRVPAPPLRPALQRDAAAPHPPHPHQGCAGTPTHPPSAPLPRSLPAP